MKFLSFLNQEQFQRFASQLLGSESQTFQPVEGSGGDRGFDGMDGEIAYQMYFPETKNRREAKYIAKIDADLAKVEAAAKEQELSVRRWIFVVPEDMRQKVVVHLRKKSKSSGIECIYWGSTKLEELVSKHPHIRNAYPEIFLPDVKEGIGEVIDGVAELQRNANKRDVEIISDTDFNRLIQERRARTRLRMQREANFGDTSASKAAGDIINEQGKREEEEIRRKKEASDRVYQITKDEVNQMFDEKIARKKSELAQRGMTASSHATEQLEAIEASRNRTLERLAIEYGVEEKAE